MVNSKKLLVTLHQILDTNDHSNQVSWTSDGKSFVIQDPNVFQQMIMPKYFNSQKLKSLQRQLLHYGFKVKTNEKKHKQFTHKFFQRGDKKLLKLISRKSFSETDSTETLDLNFSNKICKENIIRLALQQDNLSKQLKIHFKMQTLFSRQLSSFLKEFQCDCEDENECDAFFNSMLKIFSGFQRGIAQTIMSELSELWITQTPTPLFSPKIFPEL